MRATLSDMRSPGVRWAPLLLSLIALAAPGVARATVIVPQTVEEMALASSAVVRAKVLQRQSAWDKEHRRIHTHTELQVLETVHSTAAVPASLVVRTMGGEVGEIGMRVSGVARFEVGEEVLVFLTPDPLDAGEFQVVGMSQGKYRIDRSGPIPMAVASVEGLAFARRDVAGKLQVAEDGAEKGGQVALASLVGRVKTAVAPKVPASGGASAPVVPTVTTPGAVGH
jgi:hypothetical protein